MFKALTDKELEAVQEFVEDIKRLLDGSVEFKHFINIIHEIILLRKDAEYESKHIEALWDKNRNLREACSIAVDVISGRIDNASDPYALERWNEECDIVVKRLNDALLVVVLEN